MKNIFTILISLVVGSNLFAQSNAESADLAPKVKEYYETHALIFPKGIYEGYHNTINEIKLPKGYNLYVNEVSFDNFINKNEADLYSKLKKFTKLSEEGKSLYRKSYETQLAEFDANDAIVGRYPFERLLLEAKLRALDSDKVTNFDDKLEEQSNSHLVVIQDESFELEEWYSLIEKYNFRKEVEETIKLKDSDNIDLIVDFQEKLKLEEQRIREYLEYLDEWRYYHKIATTPVEKEEVKTLEKYDADVAQTLKDFPGVFTDQNRIKMDRLNHMKKILDAETEFKNAKKVKEDAEHKLLTKKDPIEDIPFKLVRIDALTDILLNRRIDKRASDMAKKTVYKPTILDEWYMKKSEPIALFMIDEEWVPVGEPSSKEILTHEIKKLGVQLIPGNPKGSGNLGQIAYYSTDKDYVRVKILSLDGYSAIVEVLGPNQSNFPNRPVIEGSVTLNMDGEMVKIFVPEEEITVQVIKLHNDYLELKKARQNGMNPVNLLFPSSKSLLPNYFAEPKTEDPNLTAETVFNLYIDAIGGKAALSQINTVFTRAEADIQGQKIQLETKTTTGGQLLQQFSMRGKVFQRHVFNGKEGYIEGQGKKVSYTDEQIAAAKAEAHPFRELMSSGAKLDGIEVLNGKEAYVISLDENTKSYYSVESGLKLQSTKRVSQGGQTNTITYALSDYRMVEGVRFPFSIYQTVGPQSFQYNVLDIKINKGLTATDFK